MDPARAPDPSGTRYVVLLRGVNVGRGDRIAMADLRACTELAGCREVRTVLATGNVVVTDTRGPADLREALETAYAQRFSYLAIVQVITVDALGEAARAYPFASLDDHHDYLVFADRPGLADEVADAMERARSDDRGAEPTEQVAAGPGCVYWRCPKGSTLSSAAGKVTDSAALRAHLTTRNLRTVHKILAAA